MAKVSSDNPKGRFNRGRRGDSGFCVSRESRHGNFLPRGIPDWRPLQDQTRVSRLSGPGAHAMSKPITELGSLFGGLFSAETRTRANEEYQRALAEGQERQAAKEQKEGEQKCWIN